MYPYSNKDTVSLDQKLKWINMKTNGQTCIIMLFDESKFRGEILSKIRGEDTDLFEESTSFTHLLEKTDDNKTREI